MTDTPTTASAADAGTNLPSGYLRAALSNYGYSAVAFVLALVVTPFMVRHLGKEDFGVWVVASSFIVYLDLFQFGFTQSAIPFVARARAVDDMAQVRRITSTAFLALSAFASVGYAAAIGAAFLLPGLLDITADQQHDMRIVMVLVATSFCLSIPSDSFGSVLAGMSRFDLLFASLSAGLLAQAAGWVGVLLAGGGLVSLAVVSLVTGLGGQASRWWLASRLVGGLRISRRHFRRALLRPLASMSFWFALRDLSLTLIERIDTLVVGFVVGVPEVAVYSIGLRAVSFIGKLVRPLSYSLMPYSAELAAGDDDAETVRATVVTGTRFSVFAAAPLCLVTGIFAAPLIHLWVGDGFAEAATVVVLLGGAEALAALVEPMTSVARGRGVVKPAALVSVGEAILNLTLSVALGHTIGIVGVALGTLIARAAFQTLVFLPITLRQLGVAPSTLLRRVFGPLLPAAGLAAAVGLAIRVGRPDGVAWLAVGCAATALVYGVVLWQTALTAWERERMRAVVRRRR